MMGWLKRWQRRQEELGQGVDADLVRDNRRKFRLVDWLSGLSILFVFIAWKMRFWGGLRAVFGVAAAVLFVAGGILRYWAQAENNFLDRPDSEEPPSILKG
jgi:hypothetical protein